MPYRSLYRPVRIPFRAVTSLGGVYLVTGSNNAADTVSTQGADKRGLGHAHVYVAHSQIHKRGGPRCSAAERTRPMFRGKHFSTSFFSVSHFPS